jgi:hypothetical protein
MLTEESFALTFSCLRDVTPRKRLQVVRDVKTHAMPMALRGTRSSGGDPDFESDRQWNPGLGWITREERKL